MRKKKSLLIAMLIAMLTLFVFPQPVQAAVLAAQRSYNDSNFHYEVYLYKEADSDPNWDYYLVKFHIDDRKYGNDPFTCPTYLKASITARQWAGPSYAPEVLTAYREPDPGALQYPHRVSLSFFGLGVSLQVPGGSITCWQDSYTRQGIPYNRYWWVCDGMSIMHVMGSCAEISIGFKVEDGMGIYVYCTLHTITWRWILLWYNEYRGSAAGSCVALGDFP